MHFVAEKVALAQVFHPAFRFCHVSYHSAIVPPAVLKGLISHLADRKVKVSHWLRIQHHDFCIKRFSKTSMINVPKPGMGLHSEMSTP